MNTFKRLLIAGVLLANSASLVSLSPVLAQIKPDTSSEQPSELQPPPTVTPPVENLQTPVATVSIPNGRVNIILVNQTGTQVIYQVLGEPRQSTLKADTIDTLRQREVPFNLSFYRPDRGPIEVTAEAVKSGELRIIFKRGANLDVDRISLTVQKSGQVFLN
ncbi:MAG TPA: hypothetical protein V6D11_18220 [Waterburya sp.]|jgi:hypothetical protein